jgi:hypothetical protein
MVETAADEQSNVIHPTKVYYAVNATIITTQSWEINLVCVSNAQTLNRIFGDCRAYFL